LGLNIVGGIDDMLELFEMLVWFEKAAAAAAATTIALQYSVSTGAHAAGFI
jgi:hypothetical protein